MDDKKELINKLNAYKLQIILNRELYYDRIISKELYEGLESSLLSKMELLNIKLEV